MNPGLAASACTLMCVSLLINALKSLGLMVGCRLKRYFCGRPRRNSAGFSVFVPSRGGASIR